MESDLTLVPRSDVDDRFSGQSSVLTWRRVEYCAKFAVHCTATDSSVSLVIKYLVSFRRAVRLTVLLQAQAQEMVLEITHAHTQLEQTLIKPNLHV